jgi:ATP-dependent Clp protease ATP-binding subunit ClpA
MFERFTDAARDAVTEAAVQARELNSSEIGPEHLILALLAQGDPVLVDAGYDLEDLRSRVRAGGDAREQEALDAESLRSVGIDLDAVREAVLANIGPNAWRDADVDPRRRLFGRRLRQPFGARARKALEHSLREAMVRHDRSIRPEHLILGITRDPQGLVRTLLEERLPIAALRERAGASLDLAA